MEKCPKCKKGFLNKKESTKDIYVCNRCNFQKTISE